MYLVLGPPLCTNPTTSSCECNRHANYCAFPLQHFVVKKIPYHKLDEEYSHPSIELFQMKRKREKGAAGAEEAEGDEVGAMRACCAHVRRFDPNPHPPTHRYALIMQGGADDVNEAANKLAGTTL